MGLRKIIRIDEEKCNGCGQCATACAEGAIEIVDGKAKLVSETYCDGLGACIGECPEDALTIETREAPGFDEAATKTYLAKKAAHAKAEPLACGCPGSMVRTFEKKPACASAPCVHDDHAPPPSQLGQWPVQLMLVPPGAPFLAGADLVVCADCVPFAVPDFHARYLAGRAVVVGCPKLDDIDYYREKLAEIFATAQPARVTVLRMEVPCCGALARAAVGARDEAAPELPLEIHTIGMRGGIARETVPAKAEAVS